MAQGVEGEGRVLRRKLRVTRGGGATSMASPLLQSGCDFQAAPLGAEYVAAVEQVDGERLI